MNDFPRWKYVIVVVVLLLGVLYGLPNLFVQQPAVQITANRGATVDQALEEKVQGILEKAKTEFGKFGDVLDNVKHKLDQASKQIEHTGVRTRAIERSLREVDTLPGETPVALEPPVE